MRTFWLKGCGNFGRVCRIRRPLGVIRRLGSLSVVLAPPPLLPKGLSNTVLLPLPPLDEVTQSGQIGQRRPGIHIGFLGRYQEQGGWGGGGTKNKGSLSLLMEQHIYKYKSQSRFFTKSRHFTAKYKSKSPFCRKPNIEPRSIWTLWLRWIGSNQRQKSGCRGKYQNLGTSPKWSKNRISRKGLAWRGK